MMRYVVVSLKVLGLIFICFVLFGNESYAETYAVRWTPFINIESLDEVDKAIDKYDDSEQLVRMGNDPEHHKLTMVCEGLPEVNPNTGREYLDYCEQGYYAKTNWDILFQFRFLDNVVVLEKLQEAKPSRVSYLEDFSLDNDCLKKLPPTLALEVKDDTYLKEAEEKGISWQEFDPSLHITKRKTDYEISVESPDEETSAYIAHVGWGDFNNDGIEDVLLIMHNFITNATYRDHEFVVLTKTGVNENIKRIF